MPRILRLVPAACMLLVLQACAATRDPGWQGQDASVFGSADSTCAAETRDLSPAERDLAYQACMGRHGWTRGSGARGGSD